MILQALARIGGPRRRAAIGDLARRNDLIGKFARKILPDPCSSS